VFYFSFSAAMNYTYTYYFVAMCGILLPCLLEKPQPQNIYLMVKPIRHTGWYSNNPQEPIKLLIMTHNIKDIEVDIMQQFSLDEELLRPVLNCTTKIQLKAFSPE